MGSNYFIPSLFRTDVSLLSISLPTLLPLLSCKGEEKGKLLLPDIGVPTEENGFLCMYRQNGLCRRSPDINNVGFFTLIGIAYRLFGTRRASFLYEFTPFLLLTYMYHACFYSRLIQALHFCYLSSFYYSANIHNLPELFDRLPYNCFFSNSPEHKFCLIL